MNHQELVKIICNEMYADNTVLALILYGSVSRNDENPNSDIDLLVITNESHFQKRQSRRDGLTVDFFEAPLGFVQSLLTENDAPIVHALAEGIALFDKASVTDALIQEAQKIQENGPPEYPTWGRNEERSKFKRLEITELYNDLLDTDDEIIFNYIASSLIGDLISLVIENNRLWYQSKKKTLDYLKAQRIEEYNYIEAILNPAKSISERRQAVKLLVDKTLEPHGGIIKDDIVLIKHDI